MASALHFSSCYGSDLVTAWSRRPHHCVFKIEKSSLFGPVGGAIPKQYVSRGEAVGHSDRNAVPKSVLTPCGPKDSESMIQLGRGVSSATSASVPECVAAEVDAFPSVIHLPRSGGPTRSMIIADDGDGGAGYYRAAVASH